MLSISYLSSVYDRKKTIELLDKIDDIDYIHLDLMDGRYVEEKNFEIDEILDDFKDIKKPLDIHLMVKNPEDYIEKLSKLKPICITFHPDATKFPRKVIDLIKSYNIKVGLAINSFIDVDSYESLYNLIDNLLIMSVKAGYGGQKFLRSTYYKLDDIESMKDNYHFTVEIDGGIDKDIYKDLQKYPIDIFVVGSYVCMNENFKRPIKELLK